MLREMRPCSCRRYFINLGGFESRWLRRGFVGEVVEGVVYRIGWIWLVYRG